MHSLVGVWVILHRRLQVLPRVLAARVHEDRAHGPHYGGVQLADIGTRRL